jgi:hypothetical protein
MDAGVPNVPNLEGGDEFERLTPVDPRVTRERGVAVAPRAPTAPTVGACAVFSVRVAIGPHIGRRGGNEGVVYAVAPAAVEADAVGGIGGEEGRRRTVEKAPFERVELVLGDPARVGRVRPEVVDRKLLDGQRRGAVVRVIALLLSSEVPPAGVHAVWAARSGAMPLDCRWRPRHAET